MMDVTATIDATCPDCGAPHRAGPCRPSACPPSRGVLHLSAGGVAFPLTADVVPDVSDADEDDLDDRMMLAEEEAEHEEWDDLLADEEDDDLC